MISPDLRFEGFDASSWTNLISLFSPGVMDRIAATPQTSDDPQVQSEEGAERQGTLMIVVDDAGAVLKAFHTTRGRVTGLELRGPEDLARLTEEYRSVRAILVREGVMDEIAERMAVRLGRSDDYVTQWLVLWKILREVQEAGSFHIHPPPLRNIPVPSPQTVQRALDVVLPDERALLAVLWDQGKVWTAFAVRRRGGAIDRVAGPDLIARWTGPMGGDWRRDHRVVTDAINRSVAQVHVGIFAEARTMRALLRSGDRGAWARAVAVRDVIVYPTPPYVAVAVGADAVRGVASRAARFLGGIDAFEAFAPLVGAVRNRIGEVASVTSTLGFNPLSALSTMLRRHEDPRNDEAP